MNGRARVMMQLQQLLRESNSSLQLHSYGTCNPNMDPAALDAFRKDTRPDAKVQLFRQYKFCVVRSLFGQRQSMIAAIVKLHQ